MPTDDFFHARLDQMIDLHHPLAVLANRLPWPQIEAALAPAFERKNRQGEVMETFARSEVDLAARNAIICFCIIVLN